jgi:hypothetical protein
LSVSTVVVGDGDGGGAGLFLRLSFRAHVSNSGMLSGRGLKSGIIADSCPGWMYNVELVGAWL